MSVRALRDSCRCWRSESCKAEYSCARTCVIECSARAAFAISDEDPAARVAARDAAGLGMSVAEGNTGVRLRSPSRRA